MSDNRLRVAGARSGTGSRAWLIASLVLFPYFLTSLVVVLNSIGNATGVVWLPSFPPWYYQLARAIYWPFQPYFALLVPLQASEGVSYTSFALISRGPFLLASIVVFAVTAWKQAARGRRHRSAGGAAGRRSGGISAGKAGLLTGLVLALALYAVVPPLRTTINQGVASLDPRDIGRLRDYLRSFGVWAPVVSFLLMVVQSVAAPLPAFVITIANGLVFGAFWGTILSWSSAMVGALLCYGIAWMLGRPVVERLSGAAAVQKTDAFFERYGSHSILIMRLIPVISFDVVSYAAGLTRMGVVPFLVATGIGQLPATIVYSVLGENITSGSRTVLWALGALLSLVVIGLAMKSRVEAQMATASALPVAESKSAAG